MSLRGLNPGTLDRRIILRFPVYTRDAIGGNIETFADLDPVWASWDAQPGREWFGGDAKQSEMPVVAFKIRYRGDVTTTWRLIHQGAVHELVGDPVEVGRRQSLILNCRRLPEQAAASQYTTAQSFLVDLIEGEDTHDVVFPSAFFSAPAGLFVQLLIPDDGFVFPADPVLPSLTGAGFTVQLGASVPGPGYKLSIQAAL